MTHRGRVLTEMGKRVGIFFLGCAVYMALAVAIGFGVDWVFGIGLGDSLQIGLFAPVMIGGAAMMLFMVWDTSKDAVNKQDEKIMRALRYTSSRDDE